MREQWNDGMRERKDDGMRERQIDGMKKDRTVEWENARAMVMNRSYI